MRARSIAVALTVAGIASGVGIAVHSGTAVATTPVAKGLPQPDAQLVARAPTTAELLASMASLVGLLPERAYLDQWAKRIDNGEPLDLFVDEILHTPRFSSEVVPAILFGSFVNVRNYYALPSAFVLKQSEGAERIYYLREPCAAAEAVAVRPWWNLTTEVKVCPDSYRPDKWTMEPAEHSYRSRMHLSCDSQVGSPELETQPLCGCGPNLIRCLRDEDQYNEFNKSLMEEVKKTTAYVVENDLPLKTLFLGNSSFRDRNAELYYRRQKIGALLLRSSESELEDLGVWHESSTPSEIAKPTGSAWPEGGQWAPREELRPGQHAGVLTMGQILHWLPDRRQRQRGYYEILWCTMRNSFGATTQKVLELNDTANIAFVHDSWQKLAHTEVCMNCHARLDYGFQFMNAYPDSRASTHFNPALQVDGEGELYGNDIRDPRGKGPLTPAGFAQLATDQPEFTSCMATHVVDYVLGARATGEDQRDIEASLRSAGTFKAAMKVALGRYAQRWRAGKPSRADHLATLPTGKDTGPVTITPGLRAKLDALCVDCHDSVPYTEGSAEIDQAFDFRPAVLPRKLVVGMADHVTFGMMPKDAPLPPAEREQLTRMLIDVLWTTPQARAEAESYYIGQSRGLPAQQIDNALFMVEELAHGRGDITWGALERGIWTDQSTITPGFVTTLALDALNACRQARAETGVALDACLQRALSLRATTRAPLTSSEP